MLLTPEYKRQLVQLHDTDVMWGSSAARWREDLLDLAQRLDAKTVLDYGCGKGHLKLCFGKFGYEVREYDPGIPGKDGAPGPADIVACLDVMEHLEYECLNDVMAHIESLAGTGVLMAIALYPSGTRLPDGRDSHLIIESPEWWAERLAGVFNDLKWEMKFQNKPRPCRNPNRVRDVLLVEITRS